MVGNIILYFVVALVMVIFSFMAVKTTKVLRAATYLLFVLLGSAIFYFQLFRWLSMPAAYWCFLYLLSFLHISRMRRRPRSVRIVVCGE